MPSQRSDPLDLRITFRFLRGLARNNDRTWFHANRTAWDGHVRHAFEDLVTMLMLAGARTDERLEHVDPRACLFRLANDTRFHTSKAPYKAWLSAWMSPGGKNGAFAGYYVHLAPGDAHFSAGIYVPTKPAIHALRSAFAEDGVEARAFDRVRARQVYAAIRAADHCRVLRFRRLAARIAAAAPAVRDVDESKHEQCDEKDDQPEDDLAHRRPATAPCRD